MAVQRRRLFFKAKCWKSFSNKRKYFSFLFTFKFEIETQYIGSQFSDFANTVSPDTTGQLGEIAAYTVWNASINYQYDKALSGFITGKNLMDKTYIVDRTRGILVGMPLLIQVGMKYAF